MNQKEIKVGDIVKYISISKGHDDEPEYYPPVGTTGVVKYIDARSIKVQWEEGSTSGDDCWYCGYNAVEVVNSALESEERMTNEEIWEMLKPKMSKNGLKSTVSVTRVPTLWDGKDFIKFKKAYYEDDVHNAIALSYKVGYLRSQKGRPFKFGGNKTRHSEPKTEKTGHWEPVDPENLPKDGTRVRYARECESYSRGGNGEGMITLGDEGKFEYGKTIGLPGIHFDDGRFWNWVCFSDNPECLDMWVEDDE